MILGDELTFSIMKSEKSLIIFYLLVYMSVTEILPNLWIGNKSIVNDSEFKRDIIFSVL